MKDKYGILKDYFGYDAFREGQETLIDALLSGQDVLGIMPTGAGKSICYQVPALMLPGITLVISPLIALMKDQVQALNQAGIHAAYINTSLREAQIEKALRLAAQGRYKIIYVAPERLETEGFLQFACQAELSMLAVDEAHCISQWGQDFRPSYLKIVQFLRRLSKRPVVGAFTATATEAVKDDILCVLGLIRPKVLLTGFDRENLYFAVETPKKKDAYVLSYVRSHAGDSGIIYCATRSAVEQVCGLLREAGIPATRYHAGLSDGERRKNQEDFQYDRCPVMAATNAFGMGIDKSNVGYVLHYNMPKDLESYYQEAGRAGRDGEGADCILLFAPRDIVTAKFLIEHGGEDEDEAAARVRIKRDLARLETMIGYCRTQGCYRGYLLDYFGQPHPDRCENCGNCLGETAEEDITVPAQMILSCILRVERKLGYFVGRALIARILRGSRDRRIQSLGLDALSTYGLMKDRDRRTVGEYIDCLIAQGCAFVEPAHQTLRPTQKADGVLFRGERVVMTVRAPLPGEEKPRREPEEPRCRPSRKEQGEFRGERSLRQAAPKGSVPPSRGPEPLPAPGGSPPAPVGSGEPDPVLLERLRQERSRLAQESRVPAYVIFNNAALVEMAKRLPRTSGEFLQISGVGQAKAQRYGGAVLQVIRDFLEGI